jgi:hypothetical protein
LDADPYIAARMAARNDPWPDAAVVHTDRTPDDSVDRAAALVRLRPDLN